MSYPEAVAKSSHRVHYSWHQGMHAQVTTRGIYDSMTYRCNAYDIRVGCRFSYSQRGVFNKLAASHGDEVDQLCLRANLASA